MNVRKSLEKKKSILSCNSYYCDFVTNKSDIMDNLTFKSFVVEETDDNKFVRSVKEKNISELPTGDVIIKVCIDRVKVN